MVETRLSAERLAGNWNVTYPPYPDAADFIIRDSVRVAKSWLDEHPADDGEPVTSDWLDTLTRDKHDSRWRLSDGPRAAGVRAVVVTLKPSICIVEANGLLVYE